MMVVAIAFFVSSLALTADGPPLDDHYIAKTLKPFLTTYCVDCHSGDDAKGGMHFDGALSIAEIPVKREAWLKSMRQLRAQGMPPADADQPTLEVRAAILEWLDRAVNNVDCSQGIQPGRVTMRRLNRAEYNNTVRDLLAVDFKPADDFPTDDVGSGFDNVGDVLTISPLLLEKYLSAAEQVAERAIMLPPSIEKLNLTVEAESARATTGGGRAVDGKFQRLASNGELYKKVPFPAHGEYQLRLRAFQEPGGDEPARAALRINDKEVARFDVNAFEKSPEELEAAFTATEGVHRVAIAFLNDHYRPGKEGQAAEDRNLVVDSFTITGPTKIVEKANPRSHELVIFRAIRAGSMDSDVREIVERFASRAFRRPAASTEVDRLTTLVHDTVKQGEPIERGIQLAVTAVLVSPHFLFRVEPDDPSNPGTPRELNDYELATRLSYFLWSSMPDEVLFDLARKGRLRDQEVLKAQVARMVADDRATALVENFAGQWLQLRNLDIRQPDKDIFPSFDDDLRKAMRRETELLFLSLVRENRDILDLLNADYTYVNERLARHYGISGIQGAEFQKVSLADQPRRGVMTHASILTLTSDPTRTSPVKRGKWVMETLLATPPAAPPPDVPPLDKKKKKATGTLRQRMEQHRADKACAVCHEVMDPIGFGLENFDGIGAWREKDGDNLVDATGNLPGGAKFNGPRELVSILSEKQDLFVRALTESTLTYALGRGLEYYDQCVINDIVAQVQQSQRRLHTLLEAIVLSDPFRKQGARAKE